MNTDPKKPPPVPPPRPLTAVRVERPRPVLRIDYVKAGVTLAGGLAAGLIAAGLFLGVVFRLYVGWEAGRAADRIKTVQQEMRR